VRLVSRSPEQLAASAVVLEGRQVTASDRQTGALEDPLIRDPDCFPLDRTRNPHTIDLPQPGFEQGREGLGTVLAKDTTPLSPASAAARCATSLVRSEVVPADVDLDEPISAWSRSTTPSCATQAVADCRAEHAERPSLGSIRGEMATPRSIVFPWLGLRQRG
jgi:hypothetical protein